MGAVKINKFLGEAPKISTELLPDSAAQVAYNTKLYSGDLIPYNEPIKVDTTNRTGTIKTLHALRTPVTGALKWLSWANDVDIAVASSTEDDEQRFYYTGDGAPKVSNYALATKTGTPYPNTYYNLGLPLPTTVPTTSAASFSVTNTASYARDSGNTATITTGTAHSLRTGNIISVRDFTSTAGLTFNATNVTVTVTGTTTFQYFNPGDAVSTVADTAGRVDLAGNTQIRTHVYTWITPWGEESIASLPTDELYIKEGQVVTITGLPTSNPSADHYIRGLSIYRTLPSASGTEYWKLSDLWFPVSPTTASRSGNVSSVTLAEPHNFIVGDRFKLSAFTTSSFNITDGIVTVVTDDNTFSYAQTAGDIGATTQTAGNMYHDVAESISDPARYWGDSSYTYTDDFLDTNLVSMLDSDFNDAPPAGLQGLKVANNNILIGFFDNQLCFSDVDSPHAWPIKHRLTFDADIVAVEPVSGYIIILTEAYPYAVSGNDPATMVVARVDALYPCLSKRSVVNMGYGVAYTTHGGVAVYSLKSGVELITKLIHDWDTWVDELTPSEVVGHLYNGKYFGSHSGNSFIFEKHEKTGGYYMTVQTTFTAAWTDQLTNRMYYITDTTGDIYEWDDIAQPLTPMEWKSKTLVLKEYMNIGAARVIADYNTPQSEVDAIAVYNVAAKAYNVLRWSEAAELGSLNGPTDYLVSGTRVNNDGTINGCKVINGDCITRNPKTTTTFLCITFKLWVDKVLVFQGNICSDKIFRLPAGYRSDTFEVSVSGAARIRAIHLGETPYGLRKA
jgi:hypothetical protein